MARTNTSTSRFRAAQLELIADAIHDVRNENPDDGARKVLNEVAESVADYIEDTGTTPEFDRQRFLGRAGMKQVTGATDARA